MRDNFNSLSQLKESMQGIFTKKHEKIYGSAYIKIISFRFYIYLLIYNKNALKIYRLSAFRFNNSPPNESKKSFPLKTKHFLYASRVEK